MKIYVVVATCAGSGCCPTVMDSFGSEAEAKAYALAQDMSARQDYDVEESELR